MRNTITFIFIWLFVFSANSQSFLEGFEEPFTKYRVSAKHCSKINHYTGSKIFIPDNAFDVSAAVDSVDIYYRELTTPLDMVIHDIPMVTELMNKLYSLESNGMFELWAMNKTDSVEVHEDRSIEVRFAIKPSDVDVRMEGFKFNDESNIWDSYTNRLGNISVSDSDNDLWGSSPVESSGVMVEGEAFYKEDSIRKAAFQSMEIYDFGLYNYDKIINGEEFVPVKANFITQNGDSIRSKVYVVYEGINSVFYYYPGQWLTDFSLIKGRSYKLFALDENGGVATLRDYPQLEEIRGEAFSFILHEQIKKPEKRESLASMIGIR